jgi:hypothetical protein
MNAMGHDVPTMIGVDHREVVKKITQVIPDYMVMGERGMHDMTEMEMPLPDNTAPMMTGEGPFGAIGMGGMFSVLKVRKHQAPGDYKDPGWYAQQPGTSAFEFEGVLPEPTRFRAEQLNQGGVAGLNNPTPRPVAEVAVKVRKPAAGHRGH